MDSDSEDEQKRPEPEQRPDPALRAWEIESHPTVARVDDFLAAKRPKNFRCFLTNYTVPYVFFYYFWHYTKHPDGRKLDFCHTGFRQ